ncbi:hypothetical protein cyc_01105 [Cyclospora cayetanensis]|uniref:Uncharacterized protein n=1 Tax=Cyclospora cayetanensis TaxID=88456 RepID=A0A1D3CYI9_9EIME|nr:hypothetical protein cyc_01105 [Cyclospora cayetanensis]
MKGKHLWFTGDPFWPIVIHALYAAYSPVGGCASCNACTGWGISRDREGGALEDEDGEASEEPARHQ